MKICILAPRFPFPQFGGDALRINEIARYLRAQGHRLILVSFYEGDAPPVDMARTLYHEVYCVKRHRLTSLVNCITGYLRGIPLQCSYYSSDAYRKLLSEVIQKEQPDLYISHLLRMAPYLEELGLESCSIVEMTDALSKTYGLSSNARGVGFLKYIYMVERRLIQKYEQYVISKFPKVVLVSQSDVDLLAQQAGKPCPSLTLHTNGVSCLEQPLDVSIDTRKICFMGNMRSLQNQDAALYFVHDIFPLIKQRVPDAKFYIVGSLPPANIQAVASDDVIVTGFIDDLEGFISNSCVAVAPVRIAAGIQNKVLVAMGCGLPVVLTPLIADAIPEIQHGVNALVDQDPQQIANHCIDMMLNPELRSKISAAGYDMVLHNYSWQEKLGNYEKLSRR